MEGIELTLCVVTEELEVRVVYVAAGWAEGWINTGERLLVEAEWEAYVLNVAT